MKILIIGGAGYIGSHVARKFLDENCSVTVYDNFSSGCWENIFPDEVVVEGDILDTEKLESVAKQGFDGIIHLAAFKAAGESMILPEKYSVNNINGTINIINCASKAGIKNIVFSSTAAVYGEPEYLPIDEEHPLNPENYYGYTKLQIEGLLAWYDKLKGIKSASLRYFNAAGYDTAGRITGLERNPANLLPVIMETAAGIRKKIDIFGNDYPTPDKTCIRDYVHVTDLADAHYLSMKYLITENKSIVLNLGSDTGISVLEMIEKARKITGKPIPAEIAPRRAGDAVKLIAKSDKAEKVLNWQAKNSSAEILISSSWEVYSRRRPK
ncbi:MAG: UDP-glucose 4-epimerase GalE [Spirochaetaceae bacterium]|nr:UDP-glucose 4-epimerase GalE [Spirochaetaceae bacterium]